MAERHGLCPRVGIKSTQLMKHPQPCRILFICMGNICRSPLAECVFRHKSQQRGLIDRFEIDSAGTGGWHAGEPPDPRVLQCAAWHSVPITGLARKVKRDDFHRFDLLVCMDEDNRDHILSMGAPPERVHLLLLFDASSTLREVPDPYYGDANGFELVFKLVDSACEALLNTLLAKQNDQSPCR